MDHKVFVDSSAWISYFVPSQPHHQTFAELFAEIIVNHSSSFTSNDIIDETVTRITYDHGYHIAHRFIVHLQKSLFTKALTQLWTDRQIQSDAYKILDKYRDHKLSLTDATSAALMRKNRIATIFTLDSTHFSTLGFRPLPRNI